jgi:hypothetical protein
LDLQRLPVGHDDLGCSGCAAREKSDMSKPIAFKIAIELPAFSDIAPPKYTTNKMYCLITDTKRMY